MNLDLLSFHIGEALEQLVTLQKHIAEGKDSDGFDFDQDSLQIQLTHAYHHLNTAWASRDCVDDDDDLGRFDEFRRFAAVFQEALGAEAAGGRGEVVVDDE